MPFPRVLAVLIIPALGLALGGPPAGAATQERKKIVTYLVNLEVDGRTVVGSFASTEKVTAEFLANPATGGDTPTSWTGEGTLNFGPIENSGLPGGCTLTNPAPTGTMKTSVSKNGGSVEVNWSTITTPPGAGVITCQGVAAPVAGFPPAEPFLLLEPKQFTLAETGGSQQLSGKLSTSKGITENTGTLRVTKREECEPKVKKVTTYPPGQQTSLSKMAGRGFSPGEKLTADTKVEFELGDGSVMRLAPGSSYKEDDKCEGFVDKSRSFKGTLLLGKIWGSVTKALGGDNYRYQFHGDHHATGVRGTRFWLDHSRTRDKTTVGKGSVWVQALTKGGKLTGPRVIVKAGHTATTGKSRTVVVRKTKPSDAFPFGANAK